MMQTILLPNNSSTHQKMSINNNHQIQSNNINNKSSLTQFEKLADNLKNNPEYKKEIYLNRLIGFYRLGSEIGTGNFSQVKLGLHLLTKEKVAVKILNKIKLDEKTQRLLLREISSMQKLHHPNIIRLYEVIHTPERLFLCMEYAPEGELYTRITTDGKINELESRIIFSQIISAVDHMHSNNIIHRDIKAENIFFSNLSPINVKIGDFGFSIEASLNQQLNTYCGSPPYAAPELFRDDNYIGIYVDIWALGVLLYFIVTSLMPFRADTVGKLKRAILNGDYIIPSFVSDSCQLLIRGLLKPMPADRFSIKEIMQSAWLDNEKFNDQLEPYQFNPTLENNMLKKEELYAIKIMNNLGISKDYLIQANITDSASMLNYAQLNIKQNTIMNNLIINKSVLANITNNLNQSGLNVVNIQKIYLTPDMKQSINGTYRILYHCIQKILNKENKSELESNTYLNKEFQIINLDNLNRNESIDSNNNMFKSSNSNHAKKKDTKQTYNDDDDDDKDDDYYYNNEENNYINKNSKSLIGTKIPSSPSHKSSLNENNSIFVKLNQSSSQKYQNGSANIANRSLKSTNVQQKEMSNIRENLSHHSNKVNSNKQSSKFCTIL